MCVEPHEEGDREYPVLMPEEYHVLQPALVGVALARVWAAYTESFSPDDTLLPANRVLPSSVLGAMQADNDDFKSKYVAICVGPTVVVHDTNGKAVMPLDKDGDTCALQFCGPRGQQTNPHTNGWTLNDLKVYDGYGNTIRALRKKNGTLVFSAVPEVTRAFCFANNLLAK